jgi:endonuclease YncB( thermonuclease family)
MTIKEIWHLWYQHTPKALIIALGVSETRRGKKMRKKVRRLDDGDSGVFSDGTRLRLNGVGAPESHQYGGSKAKKILAGMLGRTNGFVNWNPVARDRYGRQVGNMSNRDGSINNRMRSRGYNNKGR